VPTPTEGWAPSAVTLDDDTLPRTEADLSAWLWRIDLVIGLLTTRASHLTPTQMDWQPPDGGWNLRRVIHHVARTYGLRRGWMRRSPMMWRSATSRPTAACGPVSRVWSPNRRPIQRFTWPKGGNSPPQRRCMKSSKRKSRCKSPVFLPPHRLPEGSNDPASADGVPVTLYSLLRRHRNARHRLDDGMEEDRLPISGRTYAKSVR